MAWSLLVLTASPLLVGFGSLLAPDRRTVEALQCTQAILMLSAVGFLVATVAREGQVTVWFLLHADPLSAWLDIVIGIVGATGSLYAVGYLGEQVEREQVTLRRFRRFFCLFNWYLAAMLIAANVENVAIMWISIEASTLSAALLIGFERSKEALEAGWKYVILSSVGIALALFGTILVYYSSEQVLGVTSEALRWSELYRVASQLNPATIQVAWIFLLIGYGTKAGIAPMHAWLPDAHAEAPTPVSAMLSANMLTLAVYAILRFKAVVDRTVSPEFSGKLMIAFGLFSLAVGSIFLLVQRDYKRLFAYSSIEHIGVALIGFGIGGAGTIAGAWHLLNHALAKSTAFYGAGLVLLRHEHKIIERVPGLLVQMPLAGGAMMLAGLALAGMPPFGMFMSELWIATSAYEARPSIAYLFLALLILGFVTLLYHVLRMALGVPEKAKAMLGARCRLFTGVAVGLNLAALSSVGLQMPLALGSLLSAINRIFGVPEIVP